MSGAWRRCDGRFPVVMTRSPTFLQKARLFGGCHFVLGYDTAVRLLQGAVRTMEGERGLAAALEEFAAGGCRFWVVLAGWMGMRTAL